jgi:hypothetical protein
MPLFKDPALQRVYDNCRRQAADPTSNFWRNGEPFWDGVRGDRRRAYWHGREGDPPGYRDNTLDYAAWAAGRDDVRGANVVDLHDRNKAVAAPWTWDPDEYIASLACAYAIAVLEGLAVRDDEVASDYYEIQELWRRFSPGVREQQLAAAYRALTGKEREGRSC